MEAHRKRQKLEARKHVRRRGIRVQLDPLPGVRGWLIDPKCMPVKTHSLRDPNQSYSLLARILHRAVDEWSFLGRITNICAYPCIVRYFRDFLSVCYNCYRIQQCKLIHDQGAFSLHVPFKPYWSQIGGAEYNLGSWSHRLGQASVTTFSGKKLTQARGSSKSRLSEWAHRCYPCPKAVV